VPALVRFLLGLEFGVGLSDFFFNSTEAIALIRVLQQHRFRIFVFLLLLQSALGLIFSPASLLLLPSAFLLLPLSHLIEAGLFLGLESRLLLAVQIEPVGFALVDDHLREETATTS